MRKACQHSRRSCRCRCGIVAVVALAVAVWSIGVTATSEESTAPSSSAPPATEEFKGWGQPAVALVITGQQHGYIEPCGCTGLSNQKGGLARRDTLLEQLRKDRGWTLVPLDAGCQVRRSGPQAAIKFQTTIRALRVMKYGAVGFGDDDLKLPFDELLAAVTGVTDDEGKSDLFVCANIDLLEFVRSYKVIESGGVRIGVTSVLGQAALDHVTQTELTKRDPIEAVRDAIGQMKAENCQYTVVLAQAPDDECQRIARAVPGIDLIVSSMGYGEPKYQAERIEDTNTAFIQTGVKGMYVGVIGLFTGKRAGIRYQRVALDARFSDSRRMLNSLKDYQVTLQQQGLPGLGLKPVRHPAGAFVGSAVCGDCHTQAFAKWQETGHSHATDSIAHPGERSEIPRHFDPECLSCHVTGWNPQQYFPYATGYVELTASAHLHGNGCENCHGPGQAHVAAENGEGAPSEETIAKLRQQMRLPLEAAEQKCIECHDVDNSPDFHVGDGAFRAYWEKVAHPGKD